MDNNIKQLVILDDVAAINPNVVYERTALFNPDGSPVTVAPHDEVAWGDITELPTYIEAIGEADTGAEARGAIGAAANVLTGYEIAEAVDDVEATDTVLQAIAKLEFRIAELEAAAEE